MIISMYKICVTNRHLCEGDFLNQIEKICREKSADAIILREKDLTENEYKKLAESVTELCQKYHVECILHTFVQTAISLGTRNIHVPIPVLLRMSEEEKKHFDKIGTSCHSVEDALFAEKNGCSYIVAGHIFETDCKRGVPPRGINFLNHIIEKVNIPVFAIGGINDKTVGLLTDMDISGICMMSEYMKGSALVSHV